MRYGGRIGTAALALSMIGAGAEAADVRSVYTDLTPAKCQRASVDRETGASARRCTGVAGYTILAESDDDRASVTLAASDGRRYPLKFWDVITPHFSRLGPRAEWRATKEGAPYGLIVRVDTLASAEASKTTSYLAVAKIAPPAVCVTDRIAPGPTANAEARKAADLAAGKSCLTTYP